MRKKSKKAGRSLAALLAVLMTISSVPITAFATDSLDSGFPSTATIIDDPVSGSTGSGWDNISGGDNDVIITTPEESEENTETQPPASDENTPSVPSEGNEESEETPDIPDDEDTDSSESEDDPEDSVVDAEELENADDSEPGVSTPPADTMEGGQEFPWAANFNAYAEATMAMPRTFSTRETGVTFTKYMWGDPSVSDGTHAIWLGNPGTGYFFADLHRISWQGSDAFCAEFNGHEPGGNYEQGAEGNDDRIKRILASYEASSKNKPDYIAAQAEIWAVLTNTFVGAWGTSGANQNLVDPSIDISGIRYWVYNNKDSVHTQNIFVYSTDKGVTEEYALKIIKKNEDGSKVLSDATFSVEGPNGFKRTGLKTNAQGEILVGITDVGSYTVTETAPPAGYKLSDPASQTVTVTEVNKPTNPATVEFRNEKSSGGGGGGSGETTETETETEVHQSKEYEYSDAIGQVTIRKEDQDGNSLDGALVNIEVAFTDGTTQRTEGWEIDNGARLFTYNHPKDNHDPATITITEVKAPLHYELDPTPKTVTVSPTYTRVTHVTTWTITITTTTVSSVDEDGNITKNTSTATSKSEPQVEEYADFIAGDRDITVTFVNTRETGDIIVTKRDANTGQPLEGATIHLWGQDLGGVDAGAKDIDLTLVTDKNGEARFEFLPAGTYAIQETQPPFGYNLNDEIQTAVLQSGQVVRKEVRNYRKDGLFIKKVDQDGNPLPGATFELRRGSGEVLLREVTDSNGVIYRGNLTDDTYVIEEIKAPEGYLMDENPIQQIRIYATDDNKEYTVTFVNKKKPSIEITKVDGLDASIKLEGAIFRITDTRTNHYWDIETGEDGKALLENLEINTTYIVEETQAAPGYVNSGYRQEIVLRECRTHTIVVENFEKPGIEIVKKDKQSGALLAGATFRISWNNGADYRDVTTKADGTALITDLKEGWYTLTETKAPEGYLLDPTPHQVLLEQGKTTIVEIFNEACPSLTIHKIDIVTGTSLPGARYKIEQKTDEGIKLIGNYTTDADGIIYLENIKPGRYLITEVQAPDGYNIDTATREVTIEYGQPYELEFTNTPKSPIYIQKVDGEGNPLAGAKFKVTTMNGAMVGEVTSGRTGYAIIPYAEPGWYVVEEIKAPDGYILSSTPVNVEIKSGKPAQVEFVNYARPGLQILKLDASTQSPLVGARYKITKASGELIGEYTTDINGLISLGAEDGLEDGVVIITELRAPDGYVLDVTPHTVTLKPGELTQIELYNTAKPGLQLIKKDEITGLPIGGARFNVTLLENGGKKDLGSYTTSENGTFFIPDLTPGHYIITETQAAPGYILDSTPVNVEVEGGKLNTVEVFNTPYSDLRLLKIDSETRKPLEGAVFKLFDKNRLEIGTYTTSALGEIYINGLPSGTIYIQEQKAPTGYVLDNTVRQVELVGGKTTTVEWKNTSLGSLRILKVDADTNKPLYNATFNLYDSRNNLLGEYTTNQDGLIVFGSSLQSGTYKLKEVKAPEGYVLDDTIRTIKVKAGETTEIVVKNQLQVGNIQIIKVSSGKNSVTGDKAGDGLEDAIFEIYDENLNLVDKIETDHRGIATSDDLPLGRYVIKEVEAPKYYFTDGKPIYAEIKVHGDMIRLKVENTPIEPDVSVEKRGVAETMSGETFRYTFSNITNQSNCKLDEFYWHDELPTDAVRILSLNTGTWNERGTYDVWIKTNLHGWKRIERNLSTKVEYTIDMTPSALGLASNEYVTNFKLEFGTVEEGFTSVKDPFIKVKVNNRLSQGHRFVNKTDVGGRYGREWVYARDSWITVIYKGYKFGPGRPKLPQTGGPNFFEKYPEYLRYLED